MKQTVDGNVSKEREREWLGDETGFPHNQTHLQNSDFISNKQRIQHTSAKQMSNRKNCKNKMKEFRRKTDPEYSPCFR